MVLTNLIAEFSVSDKNCCREHQLSDNGYIFLRDVYDPGEVAAARIKVLQCLAEVGEINETTEDGVASGTPRPRDKYSEKEDLGEFWRSVSEGPAVRSVIKGLPIKTLKRKLCREPVTHFTFSWLRTMITGRASPLHINHP